jgi:hypothetical protein
MGYAEAKDKLREDRKDFADLKAKQEAVLNEKKSLEQDLKSGEEQLLAEIKKTMEREFKKFQDDKVKPFIDKQALVENEIKEAENEHKKNLEEITYDKISKDFAEDSSSFDEVENSLDVLDSSFNKFLGVRFKETIYSRIDSSTLEISEKDIPKFIEYLEKLNTKMKDYNKGKAIDRVDYVLDSISDTRLVNNEMNKIFVMVLAIILMIVFTKYLVPVYSIFLLFLLIATMLKSYKAYEMIIGTKALRDNVDSISSTIEKKIKDQVNRKKKIENKRYKNKKSELDKRKKEIKKQIDDTLIETQSSFEFDEKDIKEKYEATKQSQMQKMELLNSQEKELNDKMEIAKRRIKSSNTEFRTSLEKLPEEYMRFNDLGDSLYPPQDFLIDLKDNSPVFFKAKLGSSLIIYDNVDEVYNLTRLLCTQLRGGISPYYLSLVVYDSINMGVSFLPFTQEKYENLFQILRTNEELIEKLEVLEETAVKRLNTILVSASDIVEYNKNMVETKSVPESYSWIFLVAPDLQTLDTDSFKRLCKTGGKIGISIFVFIQKDKFFESGNIGKDLIEVINNCYALSNGSINGRAKDVIKTKYLKPQK